MAAILAVIAGVGGAVACAKPASDLVGHLRAVSNYQPDPTKAHDIAWWRSALDGMRARGFNGVWMVNVWADFQPRIDPPEWRGDRLTFLRQVCSAARERRMTLILAVGYVGEGWAPKGVDDQIWLLRDDQFAAYRDFCGWMARATADFDNVIYVLMAEELLPATILYNPDRRPEIVTAFRRWAKQRNPDVDHWNARWGTHFTWDDLHPLATGDRGALAAWTDHYRWVNSVMRRRLPELVGAMRRARPGAVIGYHDFILDPVLDMAAADSPLRERHQFDFYSLGWYYNPPLGALHANLEAMEKRIGLARTLGRGLPLFMGELGADVDQVGEIVQRHWLLRATRRLETMGIGYSIWNWAQYVERGAATFSLLRADGTPRPALECLAVPDKSRRK